MNNNKYSKSINHKIIERSNSVNKTTMMMTIRTLSDFDMHSKKKLII